MKITFKSYDQLITIINQLSNSSDNVVIDAAYDKFLKTVASKEFSCMDFNPYDGMFKITIPEINAYDKYISFNFIEEDITDFEENDLLFCTNCGARLRPEAKFWLYPQKTNQEAIDGWDTTSKNIGAKVDVSYFAKDGKIQCQVCRVLARFKKVSEYNS